MITETEPTPKQRLRRMRKMFAQDGGVLLDDYEYFAQLRTRGVSTNQNKADRKSRKSSERQSLKPN